MGSRVHTQRRIGVWGTNRSGKTTFLGSQFWAEMGRWDFLPLGDAIDYFHGIVSKMQQGEFPLPNMAMDDGEPKEYDFAFTYPRTIFNDPYSYGMTVLDAAGEYYTTWADRWQIGDQTVWEYLSCCDALLCLFDPQMAVTTDRTEQMADPTGGTDQMAATANNVGQFDAIMTMLINVRAAFQARLDRQYSDLNERRIARIDMPVALVMTKMDRNDNWPYRNNPVPLARKQLSDVVIKRLSANCSRYKFFGVSAVGRVQDQLGNRANVNLDEKGNVTSIYNPDKLSPFNVFEPLRWIFSELNKDRS